METPIERLNSVGSMLNFLIISTERKPEHIRDVALKLQEAIDQIKQHYVPREQHEKYESFLKRLFDDCNNHQLLGTGEMRAELRELLNIPAPWENKTKEG